MKKFFEFKKVNLMPALSSVFVILALVVLVFKSIFVGGVLAGGDAPFFNNDSLKELISEPISWSVDNTSFGGPNNILWISPITFVYGLLGSVVGLGNGLAARLTFYLPAILIGLIGMYFFAKYNGFSKTTTFFGALFYILNTYFILLVDGGQVGVALAYGIFPLTLLFLRKFYESPSLNGFVFAQIVLFINGLADPRITLIAVLTLFVWVVFESVLSRQLKSLGNLIWFLPLMLVWLLLNSFWIYPLLKLKTSLLSLTEFNFTSLLSSLFLFQSHYPANDFGKINPPQFYYAILPILIFANLFIKNNRKIFKLFLLMVIVFIFLAKGSASPFGGWYNFVISKIPLGSSFRDSTKFFVPLILFSGILIGNSLESIAFKLKNNFYKKTFLALFVLVILFLVYPTITGKMNFVLSNKISTSNTDKIYLNTKSNSFFRNVWFSQSEPTTYKTQNNPSIDGKDLVNLVPFRSQNASTDVFNFVNDPEFLDWFRILGIKYLFLNGNPRSLSSNMEEAKKWDQTVNLIEKYSQDSGMGLKRLNWNLDYQAFEIEGIYPHFFVVDKLTAVVGPVANNSKAKFAPSLFFEDGKFNPFLLEGKSPESVKILFNGKEQLDLTMSFLQKYFSSTQMAINNEWAKYGPEDYLKAKYELLIRDFNYKDLDYGQGLSFSTIPGEKLEIPLTATASGDYVLAIRSMSKKDSGPMHLLFGDKDLEFKSKINDFGWQTFDIHLEKGVHCVALENKGGLQVVNVVALVNKDELSKAKKISDVFVKHFGIVDEKQVGYNNFGEPQIVPEGTLKNKFIPGTKGNWLIFTDSYNELWNLRKGQELFSSVPVYGMVNGFYFESKWNDLHIEYKGQDFFRWGLYFSLCTLLLTSVVYFWLKSKDDGKN